MAIALSVEKLGRVTSVIAGQGCFFGKRLDIL